MRNLLLAVAALAVVVAVALSPTASSLVTGLIALAGLWFTFDAHRAESPRLSIQLVKLPEVFGTEFGSGTSVGFYTTVAVVNLSRIGNSIVGLDAEQRHGTRVVQFQRAPVKYSQANQTIFNVGGADWFVTVKEHAAPPLTIDGNGVAKIGGAFFRLEKQGAQTIPLKIEELIVTVIDGHGKHWSSKGVAPELVERPQPQITVIG